jgi:glycosyltransferase involved in cell wall biosynthesis
MLPFFLRHYEPIAERIFIYDDGSTDRSLEILQQCPKVSVEPIQCVGDSYVEALQQLYNSCWKRSRGAADWVIVCNVDEHFHHPMGLATHLAACQQAGVTIIPSHDYQMVSLQFPPAGVQLSQTIRRGKSFWAQRKTVIFSPDAIEATNFGVGRHVTTPLGRVVPPEACEVFMLHYKYLGFPYLRDRTAELESRRRPRDRSQGYGIHYSRGHLKLLYHFIHLLLTSRTVVSFGGGR